MRLASSNCPATFPGTLVKIEAEEGRWLSDMIDQDSYSYELAVLFMGAEDEEALMERYTSARDNAH